MTERNEFSTNLSDSTKQHGQASGCRTTVICTFEPETDAEKPDYSSQARKFDLQLSVPGTKLKIAWTTIRGQQDIISVILRFVSESS